MKTVKKILFIAFILLTFTACGDNSSDVFDIETAHIGNLMEAVAALNAGRLDAIITGR